MTHHCELEAWKPLRKKVQEPQEDSTSSQLYLHNSEEFLHTLKSSSYSSSREFILISLFLSDKLHKEHFLFQEVACHHRYSSPPSPPPLPKPANFPCHTVRINAPVHKQNTTSLPAKAWTIQTSLNQETTTPPTEMCKEGGGYSVERNKNTFLSKLYLYVKNTYLVGY